MMLWDKAIKDFEIYLVENESMSETTFHAYAEVVRRFVHYCGHAEIASKDVKEKDIKGFLKTLNDNVQGEGTRKIMRKGIRSFYQFLLRKGVIEGD